MIAGSVFARGREKVTGACGAASRLPGGAKRQQLRNFPALRIVYP